MVGVSSILYVIDCVIVHVATQEIQRREGGGGMVVLTLGGVLKLLSVVK